MKNWIVIEIRYGNLLGNIDCSGLTKEEAIDQAVELAMDNGYIYSRADAWLTGVQPIKHQL